MYFHQVQLPVAVFYPVVSDNAGCLTVFQVVPVIIIPHRAEMIKLKENTIGFCIIIVFVDPAFDIVIVDIIVFNHEVSGLRPAEESVPAITENTTPDNRVGR